MGIGFLVAALEGDRARRIARQDELDSAPPRVGKHEGPVKDDVAEHAGGCAD